MRNPLLITLGVLLALAALAGPEKAKQPVDAHADQSHHVSGEMSWSRLNPSQQQALQPLASSWSTLSDVQKKKWIALSSNYAHLKPADQQKLHQRMADWAALTPKQRTQARLNYTQTQRLSPEDKAERWEVYQSLTPEQKKMMIESAPRLPLAPKVAVPVSKVK